MGKPEIYKKKKIGIWMNNTTDKALVGEGISRVLAFVIKATQKRDDIIIVIGCLSWMKTPIYNFLKDLGIDMNSVEFIISSRKVPLVYRLRKYVEDSKSTGKKLSMIKVKFSNLKYIMLRYFSAINSWTLLLTLIILLAPIIVISSCIYFIFKVIYKMTKKVFYKALGDNMELEKLKKINLVNGVYHYMIDFEFERLVKSINKRKDIDCWYFPFPINPYLKNIKNENKVIAVADVVYLDFPVRYQKYFKFKDTEKELQANLSFAKSIISYCDYVKNAHVSKYFKNKENAYVIRHANIDSYEHLEKLHLRTKTSLTNLSNAIVKNYINKITRGKDDNVSEYLKGLAFEDIKYIYISSQVREHKNFYKMFEVYEEMLRKKYMNLKLIITGNYNLMPELKDFVNSRNLEFDILSFTQVPPKVHAALYARAELTVVPTLFEGGFPGPFTESVSVGTPVILSDIPVVREILDESELKLMTFNPYSKYELMDKLLWALENREILINEQKRIYEKLGERSWENVGEEYVNVFLESIN